MFKFYIKDLIILFIIAIIVGCSILIEDGTLFKKSPNIEKKKIIKKEPCQKNKIKHDLIIVKRNNYKIV